MDDDHETDRMNELTEPLTIEAEIADVRSLAEFLDQFSAMIRHRNRVRVTVEFL